jgi:hypothetical protein
MTRRGNYLDEHMYVLPSEDFVPVQMPEWQFAEKYMIVKHLNRMRETN